MSRERFPTFAWATLAITLVVILWGAYVRASGSGAGCGSHWPTCNGDIIPQAPAIQTIVEFTHRTTSGLSAILVLIELVWAFVALPRRHPARTGVVLSMVFMVNEAALGAALVLFRYVAHDKSAGRAASSSLHLVNTFLLVAALTCTAFWASGSPERSRAPRISGQGTTARWILVGAIGLLLTGVSGAVTALGDTLFTSTSLARGLADDFSPGAHFLQQLRVVHPIAAMLTAVFLLYARAWIAEGRGPEAARFSRLLALLIVGQLLLGMINFLLQAPVALQIVHLLVADLVWIAFVLLGATALSADVSAPSDPTGTPIPAGERA